MHGFAPPILAGKYRLIAELGRGGMGSVWRAEHLTLHSPVAIKLIDPEVARVPDALDRFLREAQAAAALRSQHVVQVLDFGADNGMPFIVMELLDGESLGARLGRLGVLSAAETAKLLGQVARALTRAHEAQIVHRDLKPDNIFIARDQEEEIAKVLDFGIAKAGGVRSHNTGKGLVLGTPDYMSPEHVSGNALDYRTDLWAFGVIAFECLTGKRPFQRDTSEAVFFAICGAPLPVPSTFARVPKGFDAWFARACSRNPAERFVHAKEAAMELSRACEVPSSAAPLAPATQVNAPEAPAVLAARGRKKPPTLLAWSVLAAGLILSVGTWWALRLRSAALSAASGVVSAPSSTLASSSAPPATLAPTATAPQSTAPAETANAAPSPTAAAPTASALPGSAVHASASACFKACDKPARECERSCKAPDCNVVSVCFHAEAACDMQCYSAAIEAFKAAPSNCNAECENLDRRCKSRTCAGSSLCVRERCEPLRRECAAHCPP